MPEQPSTLWVPPPGVGLLRFRATTRTITMPSGERAKVTIDDSGTVKHIERNEGIDAVVRPQTIRLKLEEPLMARADEIRAKAALEADLAEAEEALIAAKAKGTRGDKMTAIKDDLRAKRQAYREHREAEAGAASPATIKTTAGVKGR